jgi:dTDP-4-dehydrorhamnose 3,5-epimerase
MRVVPTKIPDVLLVHPDLHRDSRGYFLETFRDSRYAEAGITGPFVQDNVSWSREGTLRGLHFQNPKPQAKLVFVLSGTIFDVVVDMRVGSPTFGEWVGTELSEEEHVQLWVPEGFAHGFLVLSGTAVVQYKCRGAYVPGTEHTLVWNDPSLAIEWPKEPTLISPKDQAGKTFEALQAEVLLSG